MLYSYDDLKDYRNTGELNLDVFRSEVNKTRVISGEQLAIWSGGPAKNGVENYNVNYDVKGQQKKVASKLKELFPQAKILVVVRSPRSLLHSLYSQYLSSAGYVGFEKFLQNTAGLVFRMYDYGYIIPMYERLFGTENVLILPYELLRQDHHKFLGLVEDFFELSHVEFEHEAVNRSIPKGLRREVRFVSLLFRAIIRPLPLGLRRKVFYRFTEKLYHAKETWMAKYEHDDVNNSHDEQLLKECLNKYYRPYPELQDHMHVHPFLDSYLV